jgi:hypothetical protein
MGYAILIADCRNCGRRFVSNPFRVPAFQGHPICRNCIEGANAERRRRGLAPFQIPPDAYEPGACDLGQENRYH